MSCINFVKFVSKYSALLYMMLNQTGAGFSSWNFTLYSAKSVEFGDNCLLNVFAKPFIPKQPSQQTLQEEKCNIITFEIIHGAFKQQNAALYFVCYLISPTVT